MKRMLLHTDHARVPDDAIHAAEQKLAHYISSIAAASNDTTYSTSESSLALPFDMALHADVKKVIAMKKTLNPSMLIVIGIGGSNLGSMAVLQALHGMLYNDCNPPIKIFFADTIDTDYIQDILYLAENALKNGKAVLLNVVTKSGATTETIANYTLFAELLRSFYPRDYHKYIVVTTDQDSVLHRCAQERDVTTLLIPKRVGGRYSVFSAVGLFPLGMLGINIDDMLKGARQAITNNTLSVRESDAVRSAAVRHYLYGKDICINDLFVFSVDLQSIGAWYRQLMGESIGKEHDMHGNKVEVGITPTVSVGTTDLHSVGQLYLGGPRDKLTVFVDIEKTKTHSYIPTQKECAIDIRMYGKSMSSVMHAILTGVYRAYEQTDRPYMQLIIQEKSALCIGELLQYMMIEMMYLGYLLEVNPFDQPNVELYKRETRKILEHE